VGDKIDKYLEQICLMLQATVKRLTIFVTVGQLATSHFCELRNSDTASVDNRDKPHFFGFAI
jgi:hypothetical protein